MTKTDTWRRLAVETREGTTLLFDPSQVFYLEVEGHDTLLRTARKRPYRSTRRIADLLARLPAPPFFRCHESFVVGRKVCSTPCGSLSAPPRRGFSAARGRLPRPS